MSQLVTPAEIKALTQVAATADESKLAKAVPDAADHYLRPLLGLALLDQLLAFVADAPELPSAVGRNPTERAQDTATYATALAAWRTSKAGDKLLALWDAVKKPLAQWAVVEAWPDLLVHIDAAGVVQRVGSGQGTTTGDVATVNQVLDAHRERGVRRGEDLVRWLEAHQTDYPAYPSTKPLATNRTLLDEGFGGISL